jgi:integrase
LEKGAFKMAAIRQRGKNSYEITVSCGYRDGKKITQSKTIKIDEGASEKVTKKLLDNAARDFEREVENGTFLDGGKITFGEFAAKWLTDYAEPNLQPKTVARYRDLLKRILPAISHIKMMKLQPTHIMQFLKNLSEDGMRIDYKYTIIPNNVGLLADTGKVAELAGLNKRTIKSIACGKTTDAASVKKICMALNVKEKSLFTPVDSGKPLSDKTISEHHKLISSILTKAVYWQVINSNPAERVEPPKVAHKESEWYNLKELSKMMEALEQEPLKYQAMLNIVVYCGLRLGELSVLEWADIDYSERTIKISKQLQYLPGKGIYELDTTKTQSGMRTIPIPDSLIVLLKRYWKWQAEERLKMGDRWHDHGKLFTKENGEPIFPDTPSQWFRKFRKRHGLPALSFHGIRHTNASVMIAQGVDIPTVSKRLGHADINVTLRRYTHAIEENNRGATDAITQALNRGKRGGTGDEINHIG